MIIQCCVCKQIKQPDGSYEPQIVPAGENISHGYCPTCATAATKEIAAERKNNH